MRDARLFTGLFVIRPHCLFLSPPSLSISRAALISARRRPGGVRHFTPSRFRAGAGVPLSVQRRHGRLHRRRRHGVEPSGWLGDHNSVITCLGQFKHLRRCNRQTTKVWALALATTQVGDCTLIAVHFTFRIVFHYLVIAIFGTKMWPFANT